MKMEKTSENLFEKYFSMYANAEANLLFNGFETPHEEEGISIYYKKNIIGKLVHDPERNHPTLYINKKYQGEGIDKFKVSVIKYLMEEDWSIKPVYL